MFKNIFRYSLILLIPLILYSCSATKFIPDGEYLLDKIKIESDVPNYGTTELKPYVRQLPNYKMFGINKTMFQIYNMAGKDDSKWHNRFIKEKIGEAPVIFDSTLVEKTNAELQKFFVNKGYINAEISSEIIRNGKKADVIYRIKGGVPYSIRNYTSSIFDTEIRRELFLEEEINPAVIPMDTVPIPHSLVKEGMPFDRNMLDEERSRISNLFRNRGYYAFNKDFITFDADSSLNSNSVDVDLKLSLFPEVLPNSKTQEVPHKKYYFDKTYIYLDYDPLKTGRLSDYEASDSITSNDYVIYFQGNNPSIRPRTLQNNNFLTPGRPYSQGREDITYSSLSRLNAIANVHIYYEDFVREDSTMGLKSYVTVIPSKKQSISFSVEGTNTAGDLGVASSVSYSHRNLFRGAETFNFKVRGAYEAISNFSSPYLELGTEASIHIPKFIFPFISNSFLRSMQTSTEFSLSYNYQARPEYDRTILSGGVKYQWQGRQRTAGRHQFDLLEIDYVYLPRIDSTFLNSLPPSAEYFGYKNQFIVGSGYSYTITTYDPLQKQRDAYSLRLSFEAAGNMLYGIHKLFNRNSNENNPYKLFGTPFAQFIKGDFDFAKTIIFDRQNSIAWRIGGGIGFPYGNSTSLPFEKRYYSGGANSVRGWSVRELGPGEYQPNGSTNFYHQSGDIKLDMNIEYRTRFFWKLEAAAFIDAGNIWTIKEYEDQEGGKFKFNEFYKQIALSYGLGLRLDFDFFLIRADFGWKAHDPAKRGKDRWTILHPNFGDNFAWHIAVGYPF
ncbi:outer membrane protein assembly factor [Bacteroidales bacterium OttesenSCG-928-A17]|nr:outer membrane protein assembly factor [Bacteroidales bacterium OttesenSCG-928-A17]